MTTYSNKYDATFQFVARAYGPCAYTQIFKRQRERQATILPLVARVVAPCAFTPL